MSLKWWPSLAHWCLRMQQIPKWKQLGGKKKGKMLGDSKMSTSVIFRFKLSMMTINIRPYLIDTSGSDGVPNISQSS